MESKDEMVAARITKCGHIYCWGCILQYINYEKNSKWKRCPLCFEAVYRHELKSVIISQSHYYSEGEWTSFNLMVKSKTNIIVQNKSVAYEQSQVLQNKDEEEKQANDSFKVKIPTQQFPNIDQKPFEQCRIRLSKPNFEEQIIQNDIKVLEQDLKLRESSHEFELVPYIIEALDTCQENLKQIQQLAKAQSQDPSENNLDPLSHSDGEAFHDLKKRHNLKIELQKVASTQDQLIDENPDDCHYFYQFATGENYFLHPLCTKLLFKQAEKDALKLPLSVHGKILAIEYFVMDSEDRELRRNGYLTHMPDGAPFAMVEIDMKHLIQHEIYQENIKEIEQRQKQRDRQKRKENSYVDKVDTIQDKKFEKMKSLAIISHGQENGKGVAVKNTSYYEQKPQSIVNTEYQAKKQQQIEEQQIIPQNFEEAKHEEERKTEQALNKIKQDKVWDNLENVMTSNIKFNHIGAVQEFELSKESKKKQQESNISSNNEFSIDSNNIVVMQAKKKKKRKC